MVRPMSKGLDYFPLDVDIDQDDKIALIESDFGVEGFGIVIKLLMKIYSNGYFYEWGEKEQKLFVRRVDVDINTLSAVVNACIRWGVFDKRIFEQFEILTSKGIQKRYLQAATRRKDVEVYEDLILLSKSELSRHSNVVIVNIEDSSLGVSVDINHSSTDKTPTLTPQSKVKQSKEEESKAEESKEPAPDVADFKKVINFYQNNFGVVNPHTAEDLQMWIEDIEVDLVLEALKRATENQKNYSYAKGIMKNWANNNIKTLEDVEAQDVAFTNKNKRFNPKSQPPKEESLPDWANEEYDPSADELVDETDSGDLSERLKRLQELRESKVGEEH